MDRAVCTVTLYTAELHSPTTSTLILLLSQRNTRVLHLLEEARGPGLVCLPPCSGGGGVVAAGGGHGGGWVGQRVPKLALTITRHPLNPQPYSRKKIRVGFRAGQVSIRFPGFMVSKVALAIKRHALNPQPCRHRTSGSNCVSSSCLLFHLYLPKR